MSVLVVTVSALLTRTFVRHLQLRVSGFLKQLKFNQVNKMATMTYEWFLIRVSGYEDCVNNFQLVVRHFAASSRSLLLFELGIGYRSSSTSAYDDVTLTVALWEFRKFRLRFQSLPVHLEQPEDLLWSPCLFRLWHS
jgi:hypothetical protein